MWRPTTDRMHDPWTKCGSSDDHWVRGVLEPILLLLVIAIIGVLVNVL